MITDKQHAHVPHINNIYSISPQFNELMQTLVQTNVGDLQKSINTH